MTFKSVVSNCPKTVAPIPFVARRVVPLDFNSTVVALDLKIDVPPFELAKLM